MVKLSQQLKEDQLKQQGSTRQTRSIRVSQQQAIQRENLERQRFEELKERAKQVQEEKFKDQVVDEEYKVDVPNWNKISEINQRSYNRLRTGAKNYYLKKWKREGKTNVVTKTRKKTIPFTLEDSGDDDYSYKDVYQTLDPNLKQFFDTPDIVLEKKAQRISTVKETVAQKIAETNKKIEERKAYYKAKEDKKRLWWSNKSSKYRSNPKNIKRYKDALNNYDDDLDEDIAELKGRITGYQKGVQQLSANKDVDIKSIENYAWDIGNYEQNKEEA